MLNLGHSCMDTCIFFFFGMLEISFFFLSEREKKWGFISPKELLCFFPSDNEIPISQWLSTFSFFSNSLPFKWKFLWISNIYTQWKLRCPRALISHLLSMQPNRVPKDISTVPRAPEHTIWTLLIQRMVNPL